MAEVQLNPDSIDLAIPRIMPGLAKYSWIQEQLRRRDVSIDIEFQRRFGGFYRVRRGEEWRDMFFRLLERYKTDSGTFGDAVSHLQIETGRFEASFASKLTATIDPSLPVIDSVVLRNVGLRLPATGARRRLDRIIEVHTELSHLYLEFLESDMGHCLVRRFMEAYPESAVTDVKKLDFVLWQTRGAT